MLMFMPVVPAILTRNKRHFGIAVEDRIFWRMLFVCLFVPSLPSCHEKTTVALYFGRIRTRLRVIHFRVFRLFLWLLTTEFAACSKSPSSDNHCKASYPRTQQRVRWGWEL